MDIIRAGLNIVSRSAAGESMHNRSPSDTYFAIHQSDSSIIGIVNIRHTLDSEFMHTYGGHIGLTVRPCNRKNGYATNGKRTISIHFPKHVNSGYTSFRCRRYLCKVKPYLFWENVYKTCIR
jgi:hypothetical protein